MSLYPECLSEIRAVVTDVDGILTDGGMYYGEHGDELKKFNVRDGSGVALLRQVGFPVGVITGECTVLVERRVKKLKIEDAYIGIRDKIGSLNEFMEKHGLTPAQVAYVGDEINDIPLLGRVGCFFTVPDACGYIQQKSDFVLKTPGGHGVLREVAERILMHLGRYEESLQAYAHGLKGQSNTNDQ